MKYSKAIHVRSNDIADDPMYNSNEILDDIPVTLQKRLMREVFYPGFLASGRKLSSSNGGRSNNGQHYQPYRFRIRL
uniref:Uncharacterized protein n=1 Tax=Romanomermis culicivorax TaxID=13658 RepID=A0A915KYE1_ROMCU